jgi:uncharacterized protein
MTLKQFGLIYFVITLILYLGISLLLRWGQTKLIFFPDRFLRVTPATYNLNYRDVWIPVDREQIHGWWIPSSDVSTVLLYLHGNGSNNGDGVDLAANFRQLGLSVLTIDYRGYGKSSATFPNETRVYEDVEAAWNYLIDRQKIKPQNIFIYGHSLGGAIAIDLAKKHPEMAGLIVFGTFTSMRDMVELNSFFKILPLNWILTQKFDSITKIKSLQVPILIVHGTDDRIVPVTMSKDLFAAASEPKKLVLIPGGDHNDLFPGNEPKYRRIVQQFIKTNSSLQFKEDGL